jgi:hypothetical protein
MRRLQGLRREQLPRRAPLQALGPLQRQALLLPLRPLRGLPLRPLRGLAPRRMLLLLLLPRRLRGLLLGPLLLLLRGLRRRRLRGLLLRRELTRPCSSWRKMLPWQSPARLEGAGSPRRG